MKNTLTPGSKRALAIIKSSAIRKHLTHILCPLEEAVLKHHYKPFVYDYNGAPLYISRHASMQLMADITHRVTFLSVLIEREALSRQIPVKQREAFYNPGTILSLSPILRNRLCRLQCYTLFEVMKRGRAFFEEEQKFGKGAMQRLDELFANYKCAKLFK